jgi:hypothetical protein
MLKYKIGLPQFVSSQEGTRKDRKAGPVYVSIGEQTKIFSIYSFKPKLEKILPRILVLISYLTETQELRGKHSLK